MAISVDPPAVSKQHAAEQGFSFLFLADESGEILRAWDLLHEDGHDGHDISKPAEFLVGSDGVILWRNVSENYMQRLDAQEALDAIDGVRKERPRGEGTP